MRTDGTTRLPISARSMVGVTSLIIRSRWTIQARARSHGALDVRTDGRRSWFRRESVRFPTNALRKFPPHGTSYETALGLVSSQVKCAFTVGHSPAMMLYTQVFAKGPIGRCSR